MLEIHADEFPIVDNAFIVAIKPLQRINDSDLLSSSLDSEPVVQNLQSSCKRLQDENCDIKMAAIFKRMQWRYRILSSDLSNQKDRAHQNETTMKCELYNVISITMIKGSRRQRMDFGELTSENVDFEKLISEFFRIHSAEKTEILNTSGSVKSITANDVMTPDFFQPLTAVDVQLVCYIQSNCLGCAVMKSILNSLSHIDENNQYFYREKNLKIAFFDIMENDFVDNMPVDRSPPTLYLVTSRPNSKSVLEWNEVSIFNDLGIDISQIFKISSIIFGCAESRSQIETELRCFTERIDEFIKIRTDFARATLMPLEERTVGLNQLDASDQVIAEVSKMCEALSMCDMIDQLSYNIEIIQNDIKWVQLMFT